MVDREKQYGQVSNRIVDISTFLSIKQDLQDLEKYIESFGRTLSANERRLQQTLPGMIQAFTKAEKEFNTTGKITGDSAANMKVLLQMKSGIFHWLEQLVKFNEKSGLSRNDRNDKSHIMYASLANDILKKMGSTMERTYKDTGRMLQAVEKVRDRFGLIPVSSLKAQPPTSSVTQSSPRSALSRPFNFMTSATTATDDIEDFSRSLTDFFQSLHKTFENVIVVNKATASLKKMSDSYKGGRALQGSVPGLSTGINALQSHFQSMVEEMQALRRLQTSTANARTNLIAKFPSYGFTGPNNSSISNPSLGKRTSQSEKLGGAKLGATATKVAGLALKAIPLIGAIATGVSIILKQMKKSSPVLQAVSNLFELAWNLLWMPLGNALGTLLLPMAEDLINFAILFNELFTDFSIEKLIETAWSVIQFLWGALIDLTSVFTTGILDGLLTLLSNFFRSIGLDGIADGLDGIMEFIHGIWDFMRNLPTTIFNALSNLWSFTKNFFSDFVNKVGNWTMSQLKGIFDGIGDVGGKVAEWWDSVSPFATGGIVTSPTLGLVGEAGPEAIIPLDKANGIGTTYVINIQGDVYGVADLESRIERVIQRTANKSYYR